MDEQTTRDNAADDANHALSPWTIQKHTLVALVGDADEPKGKLPSKLC